MKLLSKNGYLKERAIIKTGIGEVNMFLMRVGMESASETPEDTILFLHVFQDENQKKC